MKIVGSVMAVLVSVSSALAVDCDSLVVDEGHFLSDVSQVEQAARRLGNAGATVRVRTFGNVGGTGNMDRYVTDLRGQCRDWQSPDGKGWKSTMLVMAYASEGRQRGVYYGPVVQPKVGDGKWLNVLRTTFGPLETAYNSGEKAAMTQGFVAALGGLQSLMTASPGGGNVTINNSTPTDYTYVWLWLFLILGGGVGGYFALLWYWDRRDFAVAQREAKRIRALCVSGLAEISSQTTSDVLGVIVESELDAAQQVIGRRYLAQFKQYVGLASSALSQFDGNDSDAVMSADACNVNKKLYMSIIEKYINPANELMDKIKAKDFGSEAFMKKPAAPSHPYRSRSNGASPRHDAPTPTPQSSTTTVHHYHDSGTVFVPTPSVVVVEAPSYSRTSYSRSSRDDDGGSSLSWGSSSGSSSSDSGGSYSSSDSGSSDSGGSSGGGGD